MKKIVAFTLLSVFWLQSCTQDQPDVAPKKITSPVNVTIPSVVKQLFGFTLEDARAILLKPVDSDLNTHLTTLYFADPKGKIRPIIENFEVKQVEVTLSGIYVLTNYTDAGEPISFFAKYDDSWVQLKGVGAFNFISDNGDIVFNNPTPGQGRLILNTTTLKVEPFSNYVAADSENLVLTNRNFIAKVSNTVTGEEQTLNIGPVNSLISVNYGTMAVLEVKGSNVKPPELGDDLAATYYVLDMKTGTILPVIEKENEYALITFVRNATGDGIIFLTRDFKADYDRDWQGLYRNEVVYKLGSLEPGVEVLHTKFFGDDVIVAPPSVYVVALNSILNIITSYKIAGSLVYYTGIGKTGKPATGFYNMISKVNIVVDDKETYSSVNPL